LTIAVSVRYLVVEYPAHRALDRVSIELPAGSVTALVGPNGAGKTTLMRCLVALDRPFSGAVSIEGIDALEQPRAVHRRVGYLSDSFGLYDDLSVSRCLAFTVAAHRLRGAIARERVETLTEQLWLESLLSKRAGTLSRGERQRVGLALALVHDPSVLVLDEPASGLDPEARHDLSKLLGRLRDGGKTIIVSSHILAELEDYSTWMLTLDRGTMKGLVPVRQMPASGGGRWLRVRVGSDPELARATAAGVEGVTAVTVEGDRLDLTWSRDEAAQADLIQHLVLQGVRVVSLEAAATTMQEVYMAQVGHEGGTRDES
jgi:ABC-2 type transport system ATP-binding protein